MRKRVNGSGLLMFSLLLGLVFYCADTVNAQSGGKEFNELIEASKAEMAQKGGQLSVAMEWPKRLADQTLKAFAKDISFINKVSYTRQRTTAQMQRVLMEIQGGKEPPFDVMGISSENWSQYEKAGVFVKPPFDYRKVAKALPKDWGEVDERSFDPRGYFLATSGLARGNAWNTEMVPKGQEPTTWEACLDPKWQGKVLYDPRPKLAALWWDPKTKEQHISWLKGIVKNKAVLNRGQTENLQKVAGGEYPIACGINFHSAMRMVKRGAPVQFAFPDPFPLEIGSQIHVVRWSKTPATTQLLLLWMTTAGQEVLGKKAYRGMPSHPKSEKYAYAKGKYVAVCDAECVRNEEAYNKLHADILNLPGVR